MPDGLQYNDVVTAQQGNTPTQQAAIDQTATQPAPSSTPSFSSLNSTNLQGGTQINMPPPVQSPDTSAGIVAGAQQTLLNNQNNPDINPAPTPLENQQSDLLNTIATLTGQDTGKAQALLDQQGTLGVPGKQQDLVNAQNELAAKTA